MLALPSLLLSLALATASTSADAALNLLDTIDFFVCRSAIDGLNGHYVLSDERDGDAETPVYVREDNDAEAIDTTHDFRLFRHNGFWMVADFASWPPTTHFRCDPTRRDLDGIDTMEACGMNLQTPPRIGYAAAVANGAPLELYAHDCNEPRTTPKAEL